MRIQLVTIALLLVFQLQAQQINKAIQEDILITNATLVTVTNGNIIGDLLIQDGKIAALGENVEAPAGVKTIDGTDKFVYPGFIDAGTRLGLEEVSAVSLTRDSRELGNLRPQMQALTAVNPNAVAISVTRTNGVTTALAVPQGGTLPGTAALIHLVGYTPEQMDAGFKGVVLSLPNKRKSGWRDTRSKEEREKAFVKKMKEFDEFWTLAKQYAKLDSIWKAGGEKPTYNPALDALVDVINGRQKLLINANAEQDIKDALAWIKEAGVDAILVGASEGWRVAEAIAEASVPVITGPIIALPTREYDRYDKAYANAGLMSKAGVKLALRTADAENVRNLPFHAGFAVAYGMEKEEALKAVTINPAEIFGLADQIGSLEVGKMANLFMANGDPFETKTAIEFLCIKGFNTPLENRQTYLYNEFLNRDGR